MTVAKRKPDVQAEFAQGPGARNSCRRSSLAPWLWGLALVVVLAACVPQAERPLTEPGEQALDTELFGSWYWQEGDETGYLHIGLDPGSGLLRVVMVDLDRSSELEVSELVGHTSLLDGSRFLNLKWLRPEERSTGYFLIRYWPEGDGLRISVADSRVLEEAVEQGALPGVVEAPGTLLASVRITAEPEALRRFVQASQDRLFTERQRVLRLRPQPVFGQHP